MAQKLIQELLELGSTLETPPSSKDALLQLFEHAATLLSDLDQSPQASILESMQPFLKAIVKPELLKHQDKDVKLLVAACLCEITRITAPEAPYSDEILKDIFGLIVGTFSGLNDPSGPSFARRVIILETLARYRSCVVMLDLECDDLVTEMFQTFISVARDDHPDNVITSMKAIMAVLVEESDDVHEDILLTLLSSLGRNKKDITEAARKLSMSVIKHCAGQLEPVVKQILMSSMSGDSGSSDCHIDYSEVIYDLYRCAPEILSGVVPYLTGELLADEYETRLRVVRLVGELFAIPGQAVSEAFQPIFTEFLKRLTDRVVEVRVTVLDYIKSCLLSYPSRPEAPQIFAALHDRLLDYDENVRKQVVTVVCDVACHDLDSVPVESVKLVAERLRDKSLLVKKYTLERLAEIYRLDRMRDTKVCPNEYDWIPGKILKCFYDKDFRSDTVEYVLCETMFPAEFNVKHRVRQWIKILPGLDKVEVKALEKILEQKQRLQQEMQKYLTFKQTYKDSDVPETQKKGMLFFRVLSRYFIDQEKADESFQVLDQLKDDNIWKILSNILDPSTSFCQARSSRDEILNILGEKHCLFDFLSTLSVKCSYILFNKEHVKEILLEVVPLKSAGGSQDVLSCMDMLVILARYSALLFVGSEDELLNLLKEDDETIKEGILHVLAMTGGTIREGLASSSISVDLILERLCLEGSRRQAKYAVHALAAIMKDGGLLSLSVLYKKLVDMFEDKPHLPSVLQSLGCIAQTATAVFETRESEIIEFIKSNILQITSKKDKKKARWPDRSELCLLKIYGIKTLVKSYLPVKDAHLRSGIDNMIELLRNILSFGEISEDIKSSSIDKAHLRLASAKAILRLSRHWDHKIPADVFHLTIRTIEQINFPQARKLFRSKIHQYVKDRVLDAKYACALLFGNSGPKQEFEECKHDLAEIIQICRQVRARQLSMQSEANCPMPYPEFILPFLIHTLAHNPLFPSVEESKDVKPFEPMYRILYLFLSMVVYGGEDIRAEVEISEKEKESISILTSILQHIKRSLDVLDATKSKNSHALCDLGLLIIKRLAKQTDIHHDAVAPLTLPSIMYKLIEKDDDGAEVGETTWLADDSVAAHFESLNLEVNGTVLPETAEDEIVQDDDIEEKEIPLGKLIKQIKSQKVKAKKAEKDSSAAKIKGEHQIVYALKAAQGIDLDSRGKGRKANKFESSNGHGKLSGIGMNRRKGSNDTSDPEPKRQRSSSRKSPSNNSAARSKKDLGHTFKQEDHEPSDSELLVSCTRKKRKGPISIRYSDEEGGKYEDTGVSDGEMVDLDTETKRGSTGKHSSGTSNKRKRRSIAGLTKSLSMENGVHGADLVDCRIKIWWPIDETFYEGIVTSYDPEKEEHVVLYIDGDVEMLHLDEERWEIIPNVGKLSKKSEPLKSPRKGGSSKKTKESDDEAGSKSSSEDERITLLELSSRKKRKGKVFSKVRSVVPSQEAENRCDFSEPEPAPAAEIDAVNNSGDPGMEKADDEVESPLPKEEEKSGEEELEAGDVMEKADDVVESPLPKGEERPESGEEELEGGDVKENDDGSEEADEDTKPSIEGDGDEGSEGAQENSPGSDVKKSSSGEPAQMETENSLQPDEANERPMEESNPQPSETIDTDDEPIGNWQRRKGKSSKRK